MREREGKQGTSASIHATRANHPHAHMHTCTLIHIQDLMHRDENQEECNDSGADFNKLFWFLEDSSGTFKEATLTRITGPNCILNIKL